VVWGWYNGKEGAEYEIDTGSEFVKTEERAFLL
jgi:hypothetical protein